ncbi:hypothetical protein OGZ02_05715 [Brachyspira hyodysenteriae]|nr:hypothetical protein [Brachyspira hyodysenteriae]MDA1468353.1 hypothetical protein [Brachyspira hyodysenteriae]
MYIIEQLVSRINSFLWDYTLLIFLCGTGLYFTMRLRFIQIREFKDSFKSTFGSVSLKGNAADEHGIGSFQSLATSIAAQVGTWKFGWCGNSFGGRRTGCYILDVGICFFGNGYNIC